MKTENNLNQMVQDYLNKTSKHLFTIDKEYNNKLDNEYYKVILAIINNDLYYIKMRFNESEVTVTIRSGYVATKNIFGSDFKDSIFPKYNKHTSIKKIKRFEEKFDEVRKLIESGSYETIDDLQSKIKTVIKL